jgi:2-aminoethylphosphonate dioxygenase
MTPASAAAALDLRERYERDGFAIVRGVFADRVAALTADAEALLTLSDLIDQNNIRCRWQNNAETGECRFDCFDPVIDLSSVCESVARDPKLLAIVAAAYGEPGHLFKDKLIFKAPGTTGYKLHQDYIGWPSFPTSFMTVIVAIDHADADSGATQVFPGYHAKGCLTPTDGDYHQLPEDAVDPSAAVTLALAPGDVALFSGYTPHRSGPNRSGHWRRLLYLSYNAHSDGGERRDAHYAEFHEWLTGRYAAYGKTATYYR